MKEGVRERDWTKEVCSIDNTKINILSGRRRERGRVY